MSRYSLPTRQLIAQTFWAAARGFERNGQRERADQARECARLVRHSYHVCAGGDAGATHRATVPFRGRSHLRPIGGGE